MEDNDERTGLGLQGCAFLALAALCGSTNLPLIKMTNDQGFFTELPRKCAPGCCPKTSGPVPRFKIDPTNGCYVYAYRGRSKQTSCPGAENGRPICTRTIEAAAAGLICAQHRDVRPAELDASGAFCMYHR